MKKTLCSLLIVAILMNFILSSVCYADGQSDGTSDMPKTPFLQQEGKEETKASPSEGAAPNIMEEGQTSQKNGEDANVTTDSDMAGVSMIGVILGYLALIIDIIPLQLHVILSQMTITTTSKVDSQDAAKKDADFWVTIDRIVFNKVALFNVNYFNNDATYKVGSGTHEIEITKAKASDNLRESIAKMFYVCRIIAMIISLLVLIYIGIRMAISTIASEQAKYKKMLFSWVESIVLMFSLLYVMTIAFYFSEALTSVFYNIKCELEGAGGESFETTIVSGIFDGIFNNSGLRLAMYSIMYWVLVYSQFKFFYLYIKRMLMVGFLIMIAPLITITYPIDKAGDGKAQAFGVWIAEFLMNVFIQPLHAIIYIVFMFTAGEIAKYAPILGLVFMLSLGTVERTVKRMFNSRGLASLGGLNSFRKGKK